MANVSKSRARPRHELERAVVASLFDSLEPTTPADASLPVVVFNHRCLRARTRLLDALVSRGSEQVPNELRKELQKLVRDWATADFDDAFKPATDFEIRCAREHDLVAARESGDPEKLLAVLEQAYRRRVIEQFGKIELRGIQTSHRVLQDLDVVYVPLHLEAPLEETQGKDGTTYVIQARQRLPVLEVLAEHRHVLIVGAPGSGKSTLVSYLATQAAAKRLGPPWNDVLPLILTVRSFEANILDTASIAAHVGCDSSLLRQVFEQQRALVFFDGLDEAPEKLRAHLIESLHRLVQLYPEIRILATSRPAGGPGEIERRMHGLKPLRLAELQREEVDEYISKWCIAAERSVRKDLTEADKEAEKAAEDLKQRLSRSYSVQRIAVNPLLVTILCVVHRFLGRSIPEHRVTLYEKCTDALLYEWDQAKFPEGAAIGYLDASAKRRLLMGIARKVHLEHAAEIAEEEVGRHFEKILPQLGRPVEDARWIVEEIRDRSGLLVERRPGFFAFSHLTFQEYLCALDFAEAKDVNELISHYAEPWWHEVIVLAAGCPAMEGGRIPRRLLALRNRAGDLLATQCMETAMSIPLDIRQRIEDRVKKIVPPRDFKSAADLGNLGIVAAPVLAQALQTYPEERPWTLRALLPMDYEPAIPAIAQCVGDQSLTVFGARGKGGLWRFSVGGYAAFILARKALAASSAMLALKMTVHRLDKKELNNFSRYLMANEELREIAKELRLETSPSKRARSTA